MIFFFSVVSSSPYRFTAVKQINILWGRLTKLLGQKFLPKPCVYGWDSSVVLLGQCRENLG